MQFSLIKSRHGVFYLRCFPELASGCGSRCRRERRVSLRTRDRREAVRRIAHEIGKMAKSFPWEVEAERERRLYERGKALHEDYGWVDPESDPLEFRIRTDDFSKEDMEAYVFFKDYSDGTKSAVRDDVTRDVPSAQSRSHTDIPADRLAAKVEDDGDDDRLNIELPKALEIYLAGKSVKEKTRNADRAKINLFIEILRMHLRRRPLSTDVSNRMMRTYSEHLDKMPKNIATSEPLTLEILNDTSRGVMAGKTRFSHAQCVSHFVKWMDDNKYAVKADALSTIKRHTQKAKDGKTRVALTDEQVRLLLMGEHYLTGKCKSAADYWVPLLAFFTGNRPGELCQLLCADFYEEPGSKIPCIRISDESDDASVKTTESVRKIPVHPTLLALGFADFVEWRRSNSSARLFPEEARYNGEFAAFSKRINRRLVKLGIKGTETVKRDFYSSRHTVIYKLKNLSCPEYIVTSINGHSSGPRAESFITYGMEDLNAETKLKFLSQIDYGLDLSKIKRNGFKGYTGR